MKGNYTITIIITFMITLLSGQSYAADLGSIGNPYPGLPNANLKLSNLNSMGELIYCGIDIGVWEDPDKDGVFTIKERKARRYITTSKNITLDLGVISDYKMGVLHKLAMRTLYVPVGENQDLIVIADKNNGKDGWVEIPNSVFKPTYFVNKDDNPYIKHTEKWEDNRIAYNDSKQILGLEMIERSYNTFWSGEKFMINVETSEVVPTLKVSINGTKYSKIIPTAKVTSEGALYAGELWDEDMFNAWGNYLPKELVFKIEVKEEGKLLEEKEIQITVDNRDQFYRIKRGF